MPHRTKQKDYNVSIDSNKPSTQTHITSQPKHVFLALPEAISMFLFKVRRKQLLYVFTLYKLNKW